MMHNLVHIALASAAVGAAQTSDASRAITAEQLYNAPNRPLMIHITGSRDQRPRLALMDHAGVLLAEPVAVRPGRVDLAEVFHRIWNLRQVAYVQLIDDEDELMSYGSSLVLQPLISPPTPRTEQDLHPVTGAMSTQIVGWDEPDPKVFSGFRAYSEEDIVLHTTQGKIRLAMRTDHAPNTVWNFRELVRGGFYNGIAFHRIVPLTAAGDPFVIQAGDPSGTGSGGPGYELALEPSGLEHDFGVISMARADDPDSAGSQFFICLSRAGTARLDGQYAAFGYAVDGADAVMAIADVELADVTAGRPADPPAIRRAELTPSPPRVIGTGRLDRRITPQADQPRQPTPRRVPR